MEDSPSQPPRFSSSLSSFSPDSESTPSLHFVTNDRDSAVNEYLPYAGAIKANTALMDPFGPDTDGIARPSSSNLFGTHSTVRPNNGHSSVKLSLAARGDMARADINLNGAFDHQPRSRANSLDQISSTNGSRRVSPARGTIRRVSSADNIIAYKTRPLPTQPISKSLKLVDSKIPAPSTTSRQILLPKTRKRASPNAQPAAKTASKESSTAQDPLRNVSADTNSTTAARNFSMIDYTVSLSALKIDSQGGRDQFAMYSDDDENLQTPPRDFPSPVPSVDTGPNDFSINLAKYMKGIGRNNHDGTKQSQVLSKNFQPAKAETILEQGGSRKESPQKSLEKWSLEQRIAKLEQEKQMLAKEVAEQKNEYEQYKQEVRDVINGAEQEKTLHAEEIERTYKEKFEEMERDQLTKLAAQIEEKDRKNRIHLDEVYRVQRDKINTAALEAAREATAAAYRNQERALEEVKAEMEKRMKEQSEEYEKMLVEERASHQKSTDGEASPEESPNWTKEVSTDELDDMRAENEDLLRRLQEGQDREGKLETKFKEQDSQIEGLEAKLREQETQLKAMEAKLEERDALLKEHETKAALPDTANLESQIKDLKDQRIDLEFEVETKKQREEELEDKVESQRERLTDLEAQVVDQKRREQQLDTKLKERENENHRLTNELVRVQGDADKIHSEFTQQIANLEAKLKMQTDLNAQLKDSSPSAPSATAAAAATSEQLAQQQAAHDAETAQLRQQLDSLQTAHEAELRAGLERLRGKHDRALVGRERAHAEALQRREREHARALERLREENARGLEADAEAEVGLEAKVEAAAQERAELLLDVRLVEVQKAMDRQKRRWEEKVRAAVEAGRAKGGAAAVEKLRAELAETRAEADRAGHDAEKLAEEVVILQERLEAREREGRLMEECLMHQWGKQEVGRVALRKVDGALKEGMGFRYKYA